MAVAITDEQIPMADESRIIEMAWEDRTPFEAVQAVYGLSEKDVIGLMRRTLRPLAFRRWRARVQRRLTKHAALRKREVIRGYCPTQYKQR